MSLAEEIIEHPSRYGRQHALGGYLPSFTRHPVGHAHRRITHRLNSANAGLCQYLRARRNGSPIETAHEFGPAASGSKPAFGVGHGIDKKRPVLRKSWVVRIRVVGGQGGGEKCTPQQIAREVESENVGQGTLDERFPDSGLDTFAQFGSSQQGFGE